MKLSDFWRKNHSSFDAVIFDIDGTVISGPRQLPGAGELIETLRDEGTPCFYLTNDGDHTRGRKAEFLRRAGLRAEESEIISCLSALPEWIRRNGFGGKPFFAVGKHGETGELPLERDPEKIEECAGVLFGEGNYDWRTNWTLAFNFFRRHPERLLLVPNPDTCWPSPEDGVLGIGSGGQARCLALLLKETGVVIPPVYLGKPYTPIFDEVRRKLAEILGRRPDPARILLAGDSLHSDIAGANRAGFTSALLLTGITSAEQAAAATGDERPDLIFDSIG